MILTRVYPDAGDQLDLDVPDVRDRLAELYRPPQREWLRLNLIASVSGSATGSDGTSETLTNAIDRMILGVIRALSDVVVVGAASVRAEGYFVPRSAALAVVSRSGDFSGHQISGTERSGRVLILCPASAVERARATARMPGADVIAVPDVEGSLTVSAIVTALRERGFPSIVAEGGPALATQLVLGGVADELCLTTSPLLNGGGLPPFGATEFADVPLTLDQLLVGDNGATYARWGLRKSPD